MITAISSFMTQTHNFRIENESDEYLSYKQLLTIINLIKKKGPLPEK